MSENPNRSPIERHRLTCDGGSGKLPARLAGANGALLAAAMRGIASGCDACLDHQNEYLDECTPFFQCAQFPLANADMPVPSEGLADSMRERAICVFQCRRPPDSAPVGGEDRAGPKSKASDAASRSISRDSAAQESPLRFSHGGGAREKGAPVKRPHVRTEERQRVHHGCKTFLLDEPARRTRWSGYLIASERPIGARASPDEQNSARL
jgi:hypothetical protein